MIKYAEGSDVAVIVIHEIYGLNAHIETVASRVGAAGYDVYCPDLLGGRCFSYAEENQAYLHFHTQVGFARARAEIDVLAALLRDRHKGVYLVGYSMGATVAWLCSQGDGYAGAAGYYGSRIRDYRDVQPACPILLFFPRSEPSFSVAELAAALQEKDGVTAYIYGGGHGFADQFSPCYEPEPAAAAFERLLAFFGELRAGGGGKR